MATALNSSIVEGFGEQSRVRGGNQSHRDKAILQVENVYTAEPDLEPEGNGIDSTDVGSLTKSLVADPSLDIVQPNIESKNEINDESVAGSNPEQTEEENQDNSAGDRLRFRLDTPTVFERANSSGGEKVDEDKCQQNIRDKDNQLDKSTSTRGRNLESTSSHKEEKDQIEQKSTEQDDEMKYDLHLHMLSVNDTNELHLNDSSKDSYFQELPSGNVDELETKRNEGRKKESAFGDEVSSKDRESTSTPASDLKSSDSKRGEFTLSSPKLEALNNNNQVSTPGLGSPTKQKELSKKNEVQPTTSFDPPKSINKMKMKMQNGSLTANSISSHRQSQLGSCEGWNENDSISSKQSLLINHHPGQLSLSQRIPVISSTNSDKLIDSNDLQLEDLEVLLQYNPSSSNSQATLSVKDCRKSELECLEDLLLRSIPSRIQCNTSSVEQAQNKNDKVQTDMDQNEGLKRLEDLLHGSIPSRISSKASMDDHVSNQNGKIEADKGQNPDLKYLEDLLFDHTPSKIQSDANLDPRISNESDDKNQELQGLEDLLDGSTPSRTQPNITFYDDSSKKNDEMQSHVDENPELENLETLFLDSPSFRKQLNASSDDQASNKSKKIEAEKGNDPGLKYLNDILRDSTSSRIQTNTNSDDRVSNKSAEIRAGTKIPSSSQSSNVESALSEKVVLTTNSTTGLPEYSYPFLPPNLSSDYASPIRDSTTILPDKYQSADNLKKPTAISQQNVEDFNEEGQLSVFSDATSGQNYIRHVSNAKKQLKRIEDEMNQLKEINDDGESIIVDDSESIIVGNNNNYGDAIHPSERHRASEKGIQSQIAKKFTKSTEQKERGIEPPTRIQESSGKSACSDEISRKVRRKTSNKKQVRPEKGSRKDSIDPVGKDIRRQKYNHREMEKDASPPSSSQRMERGNSPIPKNAVNTEQNSNRNDPPMIIRGSLEVEGSPTYWNGDHLSLEHKSKRKKKREKNRSKDGSESRNRDRSQSKHNGRFQNEIETNMNSVVSSHMERGDEGWSIPIDEVDADNIIPEKNIVGDEQGFDKVPRQVDTKKFNHHRQRDDPWEEVPCSCCCRYLPHKLVAATTHAYRLDRADEKEHKLTDFKL